MSLMTKVRGSKYARTEREVVTEETSPLISHFTVTKARASAL